MAPCVPEGCVLHPMGKGNPKTFVPTGGETAEVIVSSEAEWFEGQCKKLSTSLELLVERGGSPEVPPACRRRLQAIRDAVAQARRAGRCSAATVSDFLEQIIEVNKMVVGSPSAASACDRRRGRWR